MNMSSVDRINGLPDDVICHILSFLPTKLSVSTCALAKRWRFLWAHVPTLDFESSDFKTPHSDIINRAIALHESKIVKSFRLYNVKCSAYQLETWIIYAVQRSARDLYLDFDFRCEDDVACTLPRRLLTCETLVDLRLSFCKGIPSTGEVFLPNLKKLHLSYVEYEDDESLPHLLSGCPVLEELIINDCCREGQKNTGCIVVSSPTMKTLNVSLPRGLGVKNCPDGMLIIDVPALVYLKVESCHLEYARSLRKTMTSLIEAEIIFHADWHYGDCDMDCAHGRSIEFLNCLCHVKYLKISSEFREPLVDIVSIGSMRMFHNLTKLQLDMTVVWDYLAKFLELADNLEVLIINARMTRLYEDPIRVPTCILSCLGNVIMYDFRVCDDAFDIVRYILRNAEVLQRMEIYPVYNSSAKEKLDTLKKISLFERGSKSCQLAFDTTLY